MDMLHFALEQEMQIEQYYRQLALISRNKAVKEIFLSMADVEHTHILALQTYQQTQDVAMTPFEYMDCCHWLKHLEQTDSDELKEAALELYEAARDVKWQEEQFYDNAAQHTDVPLEKLLFSGLRKDENKGALLIDRLCYSLFREASSELLTA